MPCFTALFTIVRGAPVLFRIVTRFRGIDKPEFSGSQSLTATDADLEAASELAYSVADSTQGVAP